MVDADKQHKYGSNPFLDVLASLQLEVTVKGGVAFALFFTKGQQQGDASDVHHLWCRVGPQVRPHRVSAGRSRG